MTCTMASVRAGRRGAWPRRRATIGRGHRAADRGPAGWPPRGWPGRGQPGGARPSSQCAWLEPRPTGGPSPPSSPRPGPGPARRSGTLPERVGPHQHRPHGHDPDIDGEQRPVADDDRVRTAVCQRQPGGIGLDPAPATERASMPPDRSTAITSGHTSAISGVSSPVPEAISTARPGRNGPLRPGHRPAPGAGNRRGSHPRRRRPHRLPPAWRLPTCQSHVPGRIARRLARS